VARLLTTGPDSKGFLNTKFEEDQEGGFMTRIESRGMFALALLVLVTVSVAMPAYAQTYSVPYDFGNKKNDPLSPSGPLVQGRDGALYGTSQVGGQHKQGTVFKISPAGQMRVVYSFCTQVNCTDGSVPYGGLTLRANGHFIGTTSIGGSGGLGSGGYGTIFDISDTGTLTVLYNFTGGVDGSLPFGPPIYGGDGGFYGITDAAGGPSACGTIYKITSGGFTLLHDFDNTDGCVPTGALVLGTDGNLYGATDIGGTGTGSGAGVIFQSTPSGTVTVLHDFGGGPDANPTSPLVQGGDGNFYGTTTVTGAGPGGSVFQITPAGNLTFLYTLNRTTDGSGPVNGLGLATDGNFYGVTEQGGSSNNPNCHAFGCGTLFQVTPGGSFSVLHNFDFITGDIARGAPFQHTSGVLYGNTATGGSATTGSCGSSPVAPCGVLYSWSASLLAFVSFVPDRGKVGSFVEILGQGFTSSTTVSFNGTPATATVVSGTYLKATVPSGATTGFVTATTSSGTLTSNKQFIVQP
jgi:uncharacterized repeat protein (TIGR03803 family)